MKFLQKILFFATVICCGIVHQVSAMLFFGPLGPFPRAIRAVIRLQGLQPVLTPPMDIATWDNALPSVVADDLFPANAFTIPNGRQVINSQIIHEMFHYFRTIRRKPHVALARIVIVDVNGDQYTYAIPRVFVSGASCRNAILRWSFPQAHLINYQNLDNAITPPGGALPIVGQPQPRPIDNIIKGIEDYGFACQLSAQYQSFAHSERAAILCILFDAAYSIVNALTIFYLTVPRRIAQIVVQIKIANIRGVCRNCRCFFNHTSGINNAHEVPGRGIFRPRPGAPICNFGNPNHIGNGNYLIRNEMLISILGAIMRNPVPQINVRVSHITAIMPLIAPLGPLASVVNGF